MNIRFIKHDQEPGIVIDGIGVLVLLDEETDQIRDRELTGLVTNLEFQLRKSDGTWVKVDPERVRIATRGVTKDV